MKKIILLIALIAALAVLALFTLAACSGGSGVDSAVQENSESESVAPGEHGDAVSVSYTCVGGMSLEEDFSYFVNEKDGKAEISYSYYDGEGNKHDGKSDVSAEDIDALRALIDKYGYAENVGHRRGGSADDSGEFALDAPQYYFSVSFEDGKSYSADSAGEGASELRELLSRLAGNIG